MIKQKNFWVTGSLSYLLSESVAISFLPPKRIWHWEDMRKLLFFSSCMSAKLKKSLTAPFKALNCRSGPPLVLYGHYGGYLCYISWPVVTVQGYRQNKGITENDLKVKLCFWSDCRGLAGAANLRRKLVWLAALVSVLIFTFDTLSESSPAPIPYMQFHLPSKHQAKSDPVA